MRSMSAPVSAAPEPGMSSWIEAPRSWTRRLFSHRWPPFTSTERRPTCRRSPCTTRPRSRSVSRPSRASGLGRPQLRRRDAHRELDALAARALAREPEAARGDAARRVSAADLEGGLDRARAAALEQRRRAAARPGSRGPAPGSCTRDIVPRSSMCARPGGHEVDRPDDAVPVPPALGQLAGSCGRPRSRRAR